MLELWFEHNGHQATLDHPPEIHCFRQNMQLEVNCELYRSDDGRLWIERPVQGEYAMVVNARLNGDEYYRKLALKIDNTTTGPVLVSLNRVMQIQRDGEQSDSENQSPGCRGYTRFKVPVFALLSIAEVSVSWQPLTKADRYYYKVWRARCSDMQRLEPVLMGSIQENLLRENIPVNDNGEFYYLEIYARHGNQDIGRLLYESGDEAAHDGYPFVVIDTLGGRSWFPYVLLALLIPVVLWLVWWLLGGIALMRPGKGFTWMVLVAVIVVTGFLQRNQVMVWLASSEQWLQDAGKVSRKWYRGSSTEDGYTVPTPFKGGEWNGYLVAVGDTPFYGGSRRLEMRISFGTQTANVSLLQDGKWYEVSPDGFAISKTAKGMSLFAHLRNRSDRELWSISIPDIRGQILQLHLDRVITQRDAKSSGADSVRRQAIGELRHTFVDY